MYVYLRSRRDPVSIPKDNIIFMQIPLCYYDYKDFDSDSRNNQNCILSWSLWERHAKEYGYFDNNEQKRMQ